MWGKLPCYLRQPEEHFFIDHKRLLLSYQRCRDAGLDAAMTTLEDIDVEANDQLETFLSINAVYILAARKSFAEIHNLLSDKSSIFILTDSDARILDVYSALEVLSRCEKKHIRQGASLGEARCGTNAIAFTIRNKEPAVVKGPQHFCQLFQDWLCIAAPMITKAGELLGCVSLSTCEDKNLVSERLVLVMLLADKLVAAVENDALHILHSDREITGLEPHHLQGRKDNELSARQNLILARLAEGMTCKQIAAQLDVSPRTIESHLEKMRAKLGARTTFQLMTMLK